MRNPKKVIPDFKTFINESIWSDMQERGNGDIFKKEDDVDNLDFKQMYDRLCGLYKIINDQYSIIEYDPQFGDDCCRIAVPIFKLNDEYAYLILCYECGDPEDQDDDFDWYAVEKWVNFEIMKVDNFNKVCPDFFEKFTNKFDIEDIGDHKYNPDLYEITITPKPERKVTNSFFMEVFNYVYNNIDWNKVTQLIKRK